MNLSVREKNSLKKIRERGKGVIPAISMGKLRKEGLVEKDTSVPPVRRGYSSVVLTSAGRKVAAGL